MVHVYVRTYLVQHDHAAMSVLLAEWPCMTASRQPRMQHCSNSQRERGSRGSLHAVGHSKITLVIAHTTRTYIHVHHTYVYVRHMQTWATCGPAAAKMRKCENAVKVPFCQTWNSAIPGKLENWKIGKLLGEWSRKEPLHKNLTSLAPVVLLWSACWL